MPDFGIAGKYTVNDCIKWLYNYSWKIFNNHVDNQKISYASVYWGVRLLKDIKIRCRLRVQIDAEINGTAFHIHDEEIKKLLEKGDMEKEAGLTVFVDNEDSVMKAGDKKILANLSTMKLSDPARFLLGEKLYIYPIATWTAYTLPEIIDLSINRDVNFIKYKEEIDDIAKKALTDIKFEEVLKASIGEDTVSNQIKKEIDILDRENNLKIDVSDIDETYDVSNISESRVISEKNASKVINDLINSTEEQRKIFQEIKEKTLGGFEDTIERIEKDRYIENLTVQHNDSAPTELFLSKTANKDKIIVAVGHKFYLEGVDFEANRSTNKLVSLSDELKKACIGNAATVIFHTTDKSVKYDGTWMYGLGVKADGTPDFGTVIIPKYYTGLADGSGAGNGWHYANGKGDVQEK